MMDTVTSQPTERESYIAQANRDRLIELISSALDKDGAAEPLKGLWLHRLSAPKAPLHSVYEPSLCVIVQGSKEVFLGHERYVYDPYNYLLVTAELPLVSHVLEASAARPYFSLRLKLDPSLVGSVLVEADNARAHNHVDQRAIDVSALDGDLLGALVRLVKLLETPSEAHFLAPLIIREIVYRLLKGAQGERLRYLPGLKGYTPHIVKAIERLHKEFDQSLRMESIAHELGMSVSGFHHQFKALTSMSPLQFQKRVRLQQARRLLLGEDIDASSVAYRVGYNDASQFNREYKSLFGLPPRRDVERLREATVQAATSAIEG